MKIALLTPLYPPDIAPLASYTKELAMRMGEEHEVTVVAYGYLPEQAHGVRNMTVDKRTPLFIRLFNYTLLLKKVSRDADIIYAQNGASIEFPLVLVSLFAGTPYMLRLGDGEAQNRAKKSFVLGFIERMAIKNARTVIVPTHQLFAGIHTTVIDDPLVKPEIHPFTNSPVDLSTHEESWNIHIAKLNKLFSHGT